MAIQFFNTLSGRKETFKPIKPGKVSFYSCGPTVYDYSHIGNFRAFLTYDLVRRHLEYRGYEVRHVMNITDVDDKTIRNARSERISLTSLTTRYTDAFFEDLGRLNILPADRYPRATEHIEDMVEMVARLIEDGYAYRRDGSIYFSIRKFQTYGALANLDAKHLKLGASGVDADEYDKKDVRDFVVWKAWREEDGDVYWTTDLGKGRPGWHLECSCMSMKYLGETIDIHAGGEDLVFPHHQNEIAQSEAATGKRFANTWLHNAHMKIDEQKMSKSKGNFFTLQDVAKSPDDARALRYLVVASHYRMPLNFTMEALRGARGTLRRLNNFRSRLKAVERQTGGADVSPLVEAARGEFVRHMDDDLNSPRAVASLFDLVNEVERLLSDGRLDRSGGSRVDAYIGEVDRVLGVSYTLPEDRTEEALPEEVERLSAEREAARAQKDWATADAIRNRIAEMGYALEDTGDGTVARKAT